MFGREVWTEGDIQWLAGIIEGEGCFSPDGPADRGRGVQISVAMCDEDVINRLLKYGGRVYPRAARKEGWKPQWQWRLRRRDEVLRVLCAIYPVMGERRKARIAEMTERLCRADGRK